MKKTLKRYSIAGVLTAVTLMVGTFLSSIQVKADTQSVDDVMIAILVSCTMSAVGNDSHNATIMNGTYSAASGSDYENGIGKTTLTVFCNDYNGFAIYAIGYTSDVDGTNTLIGVNTNQTIATKVYASGDTDSNWSMKLTKITDTTAAYNPTNLTITNSFDSYHAVPDDYVKVAEYKAVTGSSATDRVLGAKLETTYAAYIGVNQVTDRYVGQVKYVLVHPSDHPAPIDCAPNATTISQVKCMQDFADVTSTNRMAIIDSMIPETQYTLKDSRDGKYYTIAKFEVPGYDYTESDLAAEYIDSCEMGECDASIYNQLSSEWQDFVDSCNGSWDNWDYDVADSLSAVVYDRVLMTKNLDLDLDENKTYTNEDTDIGYNTTTQEYDTAAWTPMRSTYTTATTHIHDFCVGGISDRSYCDANYTPESYDPGELYWNSAISDDVFEWSPYYNSCSYSHPPVCNQSLNIINNYTSSTGIMQYHLGNYYNFAASIAMNDSSSHNTGNELIEQSICPAGWTLPKYFYNEQEYYDFGSIMYSYDANYASDDWPGNPFYVFPSGYFTDRGFLVGVGRLAYFNYKVATGSVEGTQMNDVEYFEFVNSNYGPEVQPIAQGNSIRCVARMPSGF